MAAVSSPSTCTLMRWANCFGLSTRSIASLARQSFTVAFAQRSSSTFNRSFFAAWTFSANSGRERCHSKNVSGLMPTRLHASVMVSPAPIA